MNALTHAPLLTPLAWSLIHFLWQGALVGLVYVCLRRMLRHATPQSRYLLALSALLILTLLPVLTFFHLGGWLTHNSHPNAVQSVATFATVTPAAAPASSAAPAVCLPVVDCVRLAPRRGRYGAAGIPRLAAGNTLAAGVRVTTACLGAIASKPVRADAHTTSDSIV